MVLYILADLISFLESQLLQLAGSSSTVFAVNLILVSKGFSPGTRVFPSLQKLTFLLNLKSRSGMVDEEPLCGYDQLPLNNY